MKALALFPIGWCVALALGPASIAVAADWRQTIRPLREDATLTAVHFSDVEHGWAVGARGAIWHTADGGANWKLQESGVNAPLTSVQFLDAQHGFAAGGDSTPYTHTSHGVLLVTRDGGQTWQRDRLALLPALKQIKFLSERQGWAIGDTSATFPSGLFTTDDGGRSWSPVASGHVQGWLAGDFVDPNSGAVAGRNGALATVRRRGAEPSATANLGLRNVRRLKLSGETRGWLVGDGGLVMRSDDLGRTWQLPPSDVRPLLGEECDLLALEARGSNVWIAGSPGSVVLHSNDAGQTWRRFPTGQNLPLHDLTMIDDQQGWAVGALGVILKTSDGGRTWQRQRGGATRAAILGLFSEPEQMPFELFLRLCAHEGYAGHVEFLVRRDVEPGQSHLETLADRAAAATSASGANLGEIAWRFPLRQTGLGFSAEQHVSDWDRANDGQGVSRLESHLVRQIRQWRPDVVVTQAPNTSNDDPLAHIVSQLVLRAVDHAADATRFPEHAALWGLEPWKVKKVYGRLPDGQLGTTNITTSQLAPRLGGSLSELADTPRGWVFDRYRPSPTAIGFQRLIDALPQGSGREDFMSGITLHPGGEARRMLGDSVDESVDLMRRVAQKQRNLQAILAHTERAPHEASRYLAQMGDLTNGLDASAAGDVLFQLAQHYARSGRWELAVETMQLLVSRHADHPLAPAALSWLVQACASGEVGFQQQRKVLAMRGQSAEPDRFEQAAAAAKQLEQQYPYASVEPNVQFPLAVAHRARGYPKQAERFFLTTAQTRPNDAWKACATAEQWLAAPQQNQSPKSLWLAARAAGKPRLDGALDDPLWQQTRPIELRSRHGEAAAFPALAMIAYDDAFLYLAVSCRRARELDPAAAKQPRPRDPDLSAHDRVELLLDLDRDYATYYRLVVDQRGWVAEECWGDRSWNPTWFVASGGDEQTWTAEAAIPLAELTPNAPQAHHIWAVGLQRIIPGVGFQAWTDPASTSILPEGFGLLHFEP